MDKIVLSKEEIYNLLNDDSLFINCGVESKVIDYGNNLVFKYFVPECRDGKYNLNQLVKHDGLSDYVTMPIALVYVKRKFIGYLMEYAGENLADYLKNNNVSIDDRINILFKIKECLMALHEDGIVHSDIKLLNTLINDGNIKLCDLSSSRIGAFSRVYYNAISWDMAYYFGTNEIIDIHTLNYYTYMLLNLDYGDLMYKNLLDLDAESYRKKYITSVKNKMFDETICNEQLDILLNPKRNTKNIKKKSKYLIDYLK